MTDKAIVVVKTDELHSFVEGSVFLSRKTRKGATEYVPVRVLSWEEAQEEYDGLMSRMGLLVLAPVE